MFIALISLKHDADGLNARYTLVIHRLCNRV